MTYAIQVDVSHVTSLVAPGALGWGRYSRHLSTRTHAVAGRWPQSVIMNRSEWKPAGHRRGVERAAVVVLAVAAAVAAAGVLVWAFLVAVYALA